MTNRKTDLALTDRKKLVIVGFIVFVVTMAISSIGIKNTHSWGGDFSQYIAQARAIVEGDINGWHARHSYTMDHSWDGLGSDSYPWLTPILIAPIYAIWGLNYIPYQLFMSFCFAITILSLFIFLVRRKFDLGIILLICSAVVFNLNLLTCTKNVLSEIPCLMFTVISWLVIDLYMEKRSCKNAILVGLLVYAAFATRTMALALIASLGIVDLFHFIGEIKKKQLSAKHFAVMCLPYVTFLILFVLTSVVFPKSGATYLDYFAFDINHILASIQSYHELFGILFTQDIQNAPDLPEFVKNNMGLIMLLFAALMAPFIVVLFQGIVKQIKELDHIAIYSLISIIMLYLYVYIQGPRFIIYLFPVILICAYYGIRNIAQVIKERIDQSVASDDTNRILRKKLITPMIIDYVAVLVFCISIGGFYVIKGTTGSPAKEKGANSDNALAAYAYINDYLEPDDVVVFFKPRVLCLYTDVYSYTNDPNLPETIGDADYLLNYTGNGTYNEYIQNHQDSLIVQYSNDEFTLYRIEK